MTEHDDRPYIPVDRTGNTYLQSEPSNNPASPAVLAWYKAFCFAMALTNGLLIVLGLFMMISPAVFREFMNTSGSSMESVDQAMNMVLGGVYVILGLFCAIVYLAGAFLPARPWAWVVGIVLIALSFTSCCCIPFSIPLLIYWIKPEAKSYFHAS
jgi:uncharacterized membrane protein